MAQFPFSLHYTVDNGLPSSEVLDIAQDNEGYIWFATTYGISRFDGYDFENFAPTEIPDQSYILIFKGKNNRLWFLSFTGYLSYSQHGSVHPFEFNDSIRALASSDFPVTLRIDSTNTIWFKSKEKNKIIFFRDGRFHRKDSITETFEYCPMVFYDFSDPSHLQQSIPAHTKDGSRYNNIRFQRFTDKNLYFLNGRLYHLGPSKKLTPYSGEHDGIHFANIQDVYHENNGNIWLRENLKGAILYRRGDTENPLLFLQNERLTRIMKDREGNYWFATEGNGVYLVPSFQFYVFHSGNTSLENDNILAMDLFRDRILFSTNNDKVFTGKISQGKISYIREFLPEETGKYGRNLFWQDNGLIWIAQSAFLRYNIHGKALPPGVIILNKPYEIIERNNGNIAVATRSGFFEYRNGDLAYDSRNDMFFKHTQTIHEDASGMLWLGTVEGVYTYDGKTYKFHGDSTGLLKGRISTIRSSAFYTWIGTREQGLVLRGNDTILWINRHNGLNSNIIKSVFIQEDTLAWVGTNKGLNKIKLDKQQQIESICSYSIWDGLPSNEINQITFHNGRIWLATNNGISSFVPEEIRKTGVKPMLKVRSISINGHDTALQPRYELSYHKNNIKIDYRGISFKGPGKITYHSFLEGIDDSWNITTNISAIYPDLSPGQYVFRLKACNIENRCTEYDKTISFTIHKHFTETTWFVMVVILGGLAILLSIFLIILRAQKNREHLKRAMLLSEQKALRSQMNPHFIFNSLNSIQYFILEKDEENADIYLANFSTLMRKTLENSKKNFITLKEELDTLEIYLDLENLRFENKFRYQIDLDPGIMAEEIKIPPMMLQPYLENALWHGLMPKKEKGEIHMHISRENQSGIHICITDNGIGRSQAAKVSRNRKGHRSTGMKNIEERIDLINEIYKTRMKVKITDLYENHKPAGTKVDLTLPVDQYY